MKTKGWTCRFTSRPDASCLKNERLLAYGLGSTFKPYVFSLSFDNTTGLGRPRHTRRADAKKSQTAFTSLASARERPARPIPLIKEP